MKKLSLFFLLQLILISLFVCGIFFNNNYQSEYNEPPVKKIIRIISGKPKNDSLVIFPRNLDTVEVHRGDTIVWVIDSLSNVDSFRLSLKKKAPDLYDSAKYPGLQYSKGALGIIGPNAKLDTVYTYNINWKMKKSSKEWKLDPKLAVKSNTKLFNFWLLIPYGILFLSIFGVLINKKDSGK